MIYIPKPRTLILPSFSNKRCPANQASVSTPTQDLYSFEVIVPEAVDNWVRTQTDEFLANNCYMENSYCRFEGAPPFVGVKSWQLVRVTPGQLYALVPMDVETVPDLVEIYPW